MKPAHIKIIKAFIEEPRLLELSVYSGYKGGVILRMRTSSIDLVHTVCNYCKLIDIECPYKLNKNLGTYEVYCVVEDDEIYQLKTNP